MNTMTAVHAQNLRTAANHMDGLTRTLNMSDIHVCGTPACAMGEIACMPNFARQGLALHNEHGLALNGNATNEFAMAEHLFGLRGDEATALFSWTGNHWHRKNVTGPEWATEARRILAAHGYPVTKAPERIEKMDPALTSPLKRLQVREVA